MQVMNIQSHAYEQAYTSNGMKNMESSIENEIDMFGYRDSIIRILVFQTVFVSWVY